MGKKNKKNITDCEDNLNDVQKNKKRKRLNVEESTAVINELEKCASKQDSDVESKQTNKKDTHSETNNADNNLEGEPRKIKRKKKDIDINAASNAMPKNKKIIFEDDGQGENSSQNTNEIKGKKKQFLSGEEAAVTEEEIDRFCDELNEEDNVQFDDWVKQIEEKLNPHKKNKTTS